MGVDCVIAPYEADAQLAYLNRTGYADFVITEDSDLLLFGCRQVVFKLDLSGSGVLVAAASGICECCGIPASQFTESKFRFMGIMAGCDYFSGIPGIGLNTAAKGLLPFLKNASVPINLADFSGYVAAVDVYCWIHRSSYACASDLALGIPTDQTKELNRKKAAEYLMKGDKAAAQECFERSVFVTSEMAYEVLRVSIVSIFLCYSNHLTAHLITMGKLRFCMRFEVKLKSGFTWLVIALFSEKDYCCDLLIYIYIYI
ncbi:unnamed protein product [Schistosoma margrebowiei]|uniref:Exonuclease 1 n=1 Tax=Schistosoma margrebowiei TaxID=48269 RepID=A0A183NBF6_9TREM|nr:unnamed protein product [Schistosoma margrebowiei]